MVWAWHTKLPTFAHWRRSSSLVARLNFSSYKVMFSSSWNSSLCEEDIPHTLALFNEIHLSSKAPTHPPKRTRTIVSSGLFLFVSILCRGSKEKLPLQCRPLSLAWSLLEFLLVLPDTRSPGCVSWTSKWALWLSASRGTAKQIVVFALSLNR